ncbi:hypothetical protein M1N05_00545 [Dehalococcoidales bacterium]|nr:hypothetical protein [Dehalococcoidales bacterium]
MLDRAFIINHNFGVADDTIHKFAVAHLLSRDESEFMLTQGNFAYQVRGGNSGYLLYKDGDRDWVRIADWCLYGLYIVVRYRKPVWLRPMYETLFARMNFVATIFDNYSIEIVGTDGQILRSRRFRLSPPSAFNRVMSEKFGFSEEQIQLLKKEMKLD